MRKYFLLFILLLFCTCLPNFFGSAFSVGSPSLLQKEQQASPAANKWLLFIVDFDSFMCLSCLDSFLEFYHQLPSSWEEGKIWGILVFNRPKKRGDPNHPLKIIEKKLRGFIQANEIKFPVLIDRFKIFKDLGEEGTAVIIFDGERKTIKKYVFPLRHGQKQEIMNNIIDLKK